MTSVIFHAETIVGETQGPSEQGEHNGTSVQDQV